MARLPFPRAWPYLRAAGRAIRDSRRVLARWEFWFLWASLGVGIPWLLERVFSRFAPWQHDWRSLPLPTGKVSLYGLAVGVLKAVLEVALIALLSPVVRGEREMNAGAFVRERGSLALAAVLLLGSDIALSSPWVGAVVMGVHGIFGDWLAVVAMGFPFAAVYCWVVGRIADAMRGGGRRTPDRGLLLSGALLHCAGYIALVALSDLLFLALGGGSSENPWEFDPFPWAQRLLHAVGSFWLLVVLLVLFEQGARGAIHGPPGERRDGEPTG